MIWIFFWFFREDNSERQSELGSDLVWDLSSGGLFADLGAGLWRRGRQFWRRRFALVNLWGRVGAVQM